MFYTADEKIILVENTYKNQACFLILSGPSLNNIDLSKLNQPGIITFGVNNSPKVFRPDLWTEVDDVGNFMISIWKDPKIRKFIPLGKQTHKLFDNINWKESETIVSDCPNVTYYKRNEEFNLENYLTEETVNWGNHKSNGGGRSVMLAAIKIIYRLGFNKVFILGADFKMDDKCKYAFEQDRSRGSIHNNNSTYNKLNDRFNRLRPSFEKAGFYVFNCYKESGLKSFDYVPFESAIKIALKDFPNVFIEKSDGLYDRQAKQREVEYQKTHGILYYNVSNGYLVRLAVSISSLRKVYDGSISILCDKESYSECKKISDYFKTDIIEIDFSKTNRNTRLFNKTLLHKLTPYETSIYIDSDTLILKDTIRKLFKLADVNGFVATQFSDWTPQTTIINKRIQEWNGIIPIEKALDYPYAINTGVFAFKKDHPLMNDWYDTAIKGEKLFIPDEISCQIILDNYKHTTAGASFNTSCKHGAIGKRTAVIHYHGNKHCRIEGKKYLHNSKLWYNEFDKIKTIDFVRENIQYDKQLKDNLGFHNSNSGNA